MPEPPAPPLPCRIAGIDEAGLGPLLGPLAVGWVLLEVPAADCDPWRALAAAVTGDSRRAGRKLVVADSKRVFARNAPGRRRLEETALACLARAAPDGAPPRTPAALLDGPLGPGAAELARHPWFGAAPAALPLWSDAGRVALRAEALRRAERAADLRFVDLGVRVVPEAELNRAFDASDNKSLAVWEHVLAALRRVVAATPRAPLAIAVDRQGGRMRYGPLLARGFPECSVRRVAESEEDSEYALERRGAPEVRVRFAERAELASFPVALASCLAKYAREVAMEGFNAYFGALQPDLRPTAGYATDGRRWLADAVPALRASGLEPDRVVRRR